MMERTITHQMHALHNKHMQSDNELTPINRTPQPNEESENGEIYQAQEDLEIYE